MNEQQKEELTRRIGGFNGLKKTNSGSLFDWEGYDYKGQRFLVGEDFMSKVSSYLGVLVYGYSGVMPSSIYIAEGNTVISFLEAYSLYAKGVGIRGYK